jgi:two-component system chemotaxis response regulator CheY
MKPTLLLIDDNEPLLRLLKSIFDKNYSVFTAPDGVDALHLLSKGVRPELIISDVQMDHIDGFALAAHLCTSRLYRDIPVILLTGSPRPQDLSMTSNVARFIQKPFDPIYLSDEVSAVLEERRAMNGRHIPHNLTSTLTTPKH